MDGNLLFGFTVTLGDMVHGRIGYVSWVAYQATLISPWSAI